MLNWLAMFLPDKGTAERRIALAFIGIFLLASFSPILTGSTPHVYKLYSSASAKLLDGVNPYPPVWKEGDDFGSQFLYPPLFALFFYPFSSEVLGKHAGVFIWQSLNFLVFWIGFSWLASRLDKGSALLKGRWYFLALFLASNELLGSVLSSQVNPMATGLMMIGLASYMEERYSISALSLACGVFFKIFPVVMLLLLALDLNRRFIPHAVVYLSGLFFLPLAFMPWDFYMELLASMLDYHVHDILHPVYYGLAPTLMWYGVEVPGRVFSVFMLLNSLAIAVVAWGAFRVARKDFERLVFPLAMIFVLLFNNRTESLTFAIAAPLFVFMLHRGLEWRAVGDRGRARIHFAALGASWFLISYMYSDLFPSVIRNPILDVHHMKTFGALFMYAWAWGEVYGALTKGRYRTA